MNSHPQEDSGCSPPNKTDGRQPYDWESRYPDAALRKMRIEAAYLLILLFLVPVLMLVTSCDFFKASYPAWEVGNGYKSFLVFFWAWLGGTLGGTLFALKWLYHSRASGQWHLDREFWRYFAPHLSGALSFAVVILVSSGLLRIFDPDIAKSPWLSFGLAFLTGYFSDTAMAKLYEIAETVFGRSHRGTPKRRKPKSLQVPSKAEDTQS